MKKNVSDFRELSFLLENPKKYTNASQFSKCQKNRDDRFV